ncbi:MAG TPA: BON domain-containing protein [Thermoanaerobaculia bacterium]|nr:BON domain-containing protein [Thermoanaerobaculia bacterium]
MAYQDDEIRRGGQRDDYRFGEENRGRGEYRETPGRGYDANRSGFGMPGRTGTGQRGFSDSESYGQHRGYSEEGNYDPQRNQFRGGSLREGSYGRGSEGFDRETGTYSGYGRETSSFGRSSQGFTGQGFGTSSGYSEPGRFGETFGTPGRTSTRGRFTGRGPKGYTRSDERIRENVSDRLEQHGEIDASEIEVRVSNGEVTLEGTVEDRWMKRMAEDLVEECPGVKQVNNRIRIEANGGDREMRGQTGGGRGTTAGGSLGSKSTKS